MALLGEMDLKWVNKVWTPNNPNFSRVVSTISACHPDKCSSSSSNGWRVVKTGRKRSFVLWGPCPLAGNGFDFFLKYLPLNRCMNLVAVTTWPQYNFCPMRPLLCGAKNQIVLLCAGQARKNFITSICPEFLSPVVHKQ